MLNQSVLVGRLTSKPELVEEDGKKKVSISISVPRPYKNEDGEYEADIIPIELWQGIAEKTTEYCVKGDLIGIKGHLKNENDKIIFLSSKTQDK